MARELSWPQVQEGRLGDDQITIEQHWHGGDENAIQLQLLLAKQLTWWKGLLVTNSNDQLVQELWVSVELDFSKPGLVNERRDSGVVGVDWRDIGVDATLEFWKGKAFGVHAHVYTLHGLEPLRGRRTIVRWVAD